MTPSRSFRVLLLALTFACAGLSSTRQAVGQEPAATDSQRKTVAVVAVSPYDHMIQDVGYVGELIGMPGLTQTVEGFLQQTQGLGGLDKSRPWGLVVTTSGADLAPIVCLPVTDLPALLQLARLTGSTLQEVGNGVTGVQFMGQTLFVKSEGEWAYAAQSPVMLQSVPADPVPILQPLLEDCDIGLLFNRQHLPEMFSRLALSQIEAGLQQKLRQRPGEPEQEFELRKTVLTAQAEQAKRWVTDLESVRAGVTLNPEGGGLMADYTLDLVEGSQLAPLVAYYNTTGGRFSGFLDPSASISFSSGYQVPAEALQQYAALHRRSVRQLRDMAVKSINQEPSIPNDAVRSTLVSVVDDLASGVEAIIDSGSGDLVLNADTRIGGLAFQFAVHAPQPDKFDTALKKLVALVEDDPEMPGVNWNAETHSGVTLHTFGMSLQRIEEQEILGSYLSITVGVSQDAFYFAVGPQSLRSLKQGITESLSKPDEEGKPLRLSVDLARIAQFAAVVAQVHGASGGPLVSVGSGLRNGQHSSLHLTTEGSPTGMRTWFHLEHDALKALVGEAMKRSARAALSPPGGPMPPGMDMPPGGDFPIDGGVPFDEDSPAVDPFATEPDEPAEDPFSTDDPFGGDTDDGF